MNNQIHIVSKYFIPVTAGIEVNILNTYKVLASKGWDVALHACNNTFTEQGSLPSSETIEGIRVRRYPWRWYGYWPRFESSETSDVKNSKTLDVGDESTRSHHYILALHNFDVFPHSLLILKTLMLKLLGRKNYTLVLTPHGGFSLDSVWHLFPWWQRIIKRVYHNFIAPTLLNLTVDGIRAVSEWEKQEMIKIGVSPGKIRVIANGLEDDAYEDIDKKASKSIKQQAKSWGKYLIQIGRVYPIKNYETVIRALPALPKAIKFVIVGPVEVNKFPEYVDQLHQLVKDLNLQDRVIFTGVIKGIDKYYAIKHSQMMVHMAEWESFCNVVHEGMSQGKVCIVADNTALPLLINNGKNGYCIPTHDYKKLAETINYILKNKNTQKIKKIAKLNRQQGLQESWKNVALKMDTWYSQLIKRDPDIRIASDQP